MKHMLATLLALAVSTVQAQTRDVVQFNCALRSGVLSVDNINKPTINSTKRPTLPIAGTSCTSAIDMLLSQRFKLFDTNDLQLLYVFQRKARLKDD